MKKKLPGHTLLYASFIICSCGSPPAADLKTSAFKDSSDRAARLMDSISHTDAYLYEKANYLEKKDSGEKALPIYRDIAHSGRNKDYQTLAAGRMHYLESLRFLAFIKSGSAGETDVRTYHRHFAIRNIDSFLTFISASGLKIIDDNEVDTVQYSIKELRRQLVQRKGPAFEIITQLSYIYSQPSPQYSTTNFTLSTDSTTGIDVSVGTDYQLLFRLKGNDMPYKLVELESYHIDDL